MDTSTALQPLEERNQRQGHLAWFEKYNNSMYVILNLIHAGAMLINLSILLTLSCARRLRTTSYMILASLAVADLLFALVMTIDKHAKLGQHLPSGENSWVLRSFVFMVLPQFPIMASQMHTLLIAADKYVAIMYPLRYDTLWQPAKVKWLLLGAWVVALFLSCTVIAWDALWEDIKTDQMPTIRSLLTAVVTYLVEVIVVSFLYSRILTVARKQRRQIREVGTTGGTSSPGPKTPRGSRLLTLTIIIIFLCWGPFFLMTLLMYFMDEVEPWHYALLGVLLALGFSHYLVNFGMLLMQSKDFRTAYRQLLLCRFGQLGERG